VIRRAPRLGAARVPRRRTVLIPGALACCLLVASCGGVKTATTTTIPSTSRANVLVAQGSATVTVVVPAVATNLNPHVPAGDTAATKMVAALTDPQIFEVDPDLTPDLDTNFVQNAEVVSVNPQVVTYTLNPLATWSDGVPIGLQDFLFNWKEQVSAGNPTFASTSNLGYSDIQTITGSSTSDTVRVVFAHPYGDWEDLFNNLIPAHVSSVLGWAEGFSHPGQTAFVSGGPYEVAS
jgi:peptide/nickel transport system substrate-binding protein